MKRIQVAPALATALSYAWPMFFLLPSALADGTMHIISLALAVNALVAKACCVTFQSVS